MSDRDQPSTYRVGASGADFSKAILYKDGKRVARLGYHGHHPSVCVKVYDVGTIETKDLREELGGDLLQDIYNELQNSFWDFRAREIALQYGFKDVYSAGRSDGWIVVSEIEFPPDDCDSDDYDLLERFYGFAEAITAEVEYLSGPCFDDQVRDVYAALEARRDAMAIRGEN